ncbi:MAG: hypothetical protein FJ255_03755 [Phycisphaerae bacterium]|nr:hypothetical protein [Phycisphaerae bacterium]
MWIATLSLLIALGQPEPTTPPGLPPPPAPVAAEVEWAVVTRADLVAASTRFERIYRALTDRQARAREANRAFDVATASFLGGRMNDAIRALRTGADALAAEGEASPAQALASSLRVTVEPAVYGRAMSRAPRLAIEQWYGPESPARVTLGVSLLPIDALEPLTLAVDVAYTPGTPVSMSVPLDAGAWLGKASGAYLVSVGVGEQSDPGPLFFCVLSEPAGQTLHALKPRIDALNAGAALSPSALATLRGTWSLLGGGVNPQESASFMTPMSTRADTLAAEVTLAEGKVSPFAGRAGMTWRLLDSGGRLVPYVTHVPVGRTGAMPVVVAFHGTGGDEYSFQVVHGDGELRRQADARGFIAVSPRAEAFIGNPDLFDALLREVARDYAIDRARVYVLGHSTGAAAASALAAARPDSLAAAVCLAGGDSLRGERVAPTLVIAGQFDPIIPPARLKVAAEQARAAGAPVEYREAPGQGHALIVGDLLGEALDWLWGRRLNARP